MDTFTDLTADTLLPKIDIRSLPEIKIAPALKELLKQVFEDTGDYDNVKIMDYTSSIHVKKSGNTVIFANQYYLIAAYYFDFATALISYFSFFDATIRDNKDLEKIIYDKDFDRLPEAIFKEKNERLLFINFLRNLGKDFVNKDKESVKSRPTMDVFGSCVLSKINVPNASSSTLGDVIYFLAKKEEVYKKLKKELIKDECVLLESESAAGFLMNVLKKTLICDPDLSQMAKKFSETQTSLSVNGFVFGRNVKHLPTRDSDYDLSIFWSYNGNRFCGYKEFYPINLVQKFFPQYNETYKGKYRLEEKNGKYLMIELSDCRLGDKTKKILEPIYKCSQVIYYGVPGCGKSHSVDKIINDAIAEFNKNKNAESQITYEKQVIRTVFHPDYCYADFVGQIMPKKEQDGGIKYEFKPGPLANIIRKAYLNPTKPYFLIIEEINRGNASAIFGETFQLLDRYKNGKHSSEEEIRNENYDYTEGWSKYSINNDDLNGFILLGGESDVTEKESGVVYESDSSETPKSAIKIPSRNLHFSTYSGVRLPPNLSLYATMNTSDQNVFTLDNAFQRRWEMKQISNKLDEKEKKLDGTPGDQQVQYNKIIGNTDVKWGDFREKINEIIMQSAEENGLSSMEDKRLGGWFITPKKAVDADKDALPEITTQAFAEKVLKYLWDDAFKFDRKSHFADGDKSFKTLEDLIDSFNEKGFKVFKDETIKDLQVKTSLKSPAESDDDVNSNGQSNT